MAEKKSTVKKAAPKKAAVVKTIEDLRKEVADKQSDLLNAKRGHAAGELVNPRVITTTRKEIARLHTAIRAAELAEKESK